MFKSETFVKIRIWSVVLIWLGLVAYYLINYAFSAEKAKALLGIIIGAFAAIIIAFYQRFNTIFS